LAQTGVRDPTDLYALTVKEFKSRGLICTQTDAVIYARCSVVGRAAAEPYRPLKKLNQVCDPSTRDEARRIAAKHCEVA
jgi:hypothetical protein